MTHKIIKSGKSCFVASHDTVSSKSGEAYTPVFIPYTAQEMANRKTTALGHIQYVNRDNLKHVE